MSLIRYRKLTYVVSGTLVLASIILFFTWGLKLGIDFTGGSLLEIEYKTARPSLDEINQRLVRAGIVHSVVQPTGERGVLIRAEHLTESAHQALVTSLAGGDRAQIIEKRFDTIGPTIGGELKRRSVYAIVLVIALIVLYIAWAFRKVSEPVESWKYGVATIVALVHDVMIPVGIFVVLGHFFDTEVDTLFVTALLTILGFSVHDTIVVFDRIRENLNPVRSRALQMPAASSMQTSNGVKNAKGKLDFETVVGASITQTITRSINTSLTVLLVLAAIYFFGGASTKLFSLALIVGIFFGTYSSIFLASPILVTWHAWSQRQA